MSGPELWPPPARGGSAVRCYHCLDRFSWDQRTVYDVTSATEIELDKIAEPAKRREAMLDAYVRCPNPSLDYPEPHYLPLDYVRYLPPLVIGLVATYEAGKTTLFATIANQIDNDCLGAYGLLAKPVMRHLHNRFQADVIRPFIRDGKRLPATKAAAQKVEFAAAYVLSKGSVKQPVAFFDVGGESLALGGPETRFVQALSGLIFVVDPRRALGLTEDSRDQVGRPSSAGDQAFDRVLDRLGTTDHYDAISAAIVLGQADTLRFEPTIGQWLGDDEANGTIDAARFRAESRDVYAYLYEHDAMAWLRPFESFRRCTLHVVSATGGNHQNEVYQRGLRPRRALEPLIALLCMAGVIEGPEADLVGR